MLLSAVLFTREPPHEVRTEIHNKFDTVIFANETACSWKVSGMSRRMFHDPRNALITQATYITVTFAYHIPFRSYVNEVQSV
jgi:hypothetical protein